jgi:hypothetical protein
MGVSGGRDARQDAIIVGRLSRFAGENRCEGILCEPVCQHLRSFRCSDLAQALCPELIRLRSEAQEALKQSRTVPASERWYMYNRLSEAWAAAVRYANDNRESCHISNASLNEFERYHREAVKDRDMFAQAALFAHMEQTIIQH